MFAICTIRPDPNYRRDAFLGGLRAAGYRIADGGNPQCTGDLLVIWNRYGANEARADNWEAQGGTVLVAENGYIGKDKDGRQLYALAVHGHNGSGWFPVGDEDRFGKLGIPVEPWVQRPEGYVLVCGQRGIGSRAMASPANWHAEAARYCAKGEKVKIRLHPGNKPATTKLEADLEGANTCAIWSSAAGVKALTLGIPVKYDAPHWICADAATKLRSGEVIRTDEPRACALHKMAWGQWTVAELESGEPFKRILEGLGSAKW